MAYINVAEWTPDQVTDWLKGLDDSMYNYVYSFTNNEVGGRQLLNIRPYELEQLGMHAIGHQEIVLEAVENLRNFHFNLDKENLQFMALHVATAARSLYRQLAIDCEATKIETQILSDITRTIATIKPLISWLDRVPFHGQQQFTEICSNMLRRGLEMATIAQRDRFAVKPVEQIRDTALHLEKLANYIIQDITDPMLLQPASLNLVTLKKRESELGFSIEPNYHGIHRVTDIKYNSPAHNSGKIEDGDEIVQINYQTVVGWQYKTVLLQLRESLPDVLLTLKKRPKHTKIYGQIYMQPYRLPSKKRNVASRWGDNLPSPRAGFLTVPEAATAFNLPLSLKPEEKAGAANCSPSDTESSSDSDILTPTDNKCAEKEIRLYYPKPRAMLQRRNTICGDEYLSLKSGSGIFPQWRERQGAGLGMCGEPASPSLRDKSVSFGFGLDATLPRPTTCLGLAASSTSKLTSGLFRENAAATATTKKSNCIASIDSAALSPVPEEHYKLGVSKVVRFDANMTIDSYQVDEKYICNVENTILETFEPIPFADEDAEEADLNASKINQDEQVAEAVNQPLVATRRGRLDKSHSTPAYDNSGEESSDTPPPPAIEPRNATLLQMPPVPPPRPRKQKEMSPSAVPPPPPKPLSLKPQPQPRTMMDAIPSTVQEIFTKAETSVNVAQLSLDLPVPVSEVNELHTPTKSRTLTLKKKHNLIAKRRNVNLKLLGTGEIQGHLYRRTKDRRGVTFWARVYFVLLDTILYGFRAKDATKASCVIFLPGFTVSLAKEVHSKPYAFKVYHAAKSFYFAAESQDALNQWLEFIRQATLHPTPKLSDINVRDLFSETESSGEENEMIILKNLCTPSPQTNKDLLNMSLGSAINTTTNSVKNTNTPVSSTKHDRRYLGSLRKLTKNTLHFKSSSSSSSSNDKKASSDIPVPTEQYRSYRKVPGGSFGLQIGTNTAGSYHHEAALQQATSQIALAISSLETEEKAPALPRKLSLKATSPSNYEATTPTSAAPLEGMMCPDINSSNNNYNKQTATMTIISTTAITSPTSTQSSSSHRSSPNDSPSIRSIKKIPYNFIHASNPNLVEFDFQTSKTLDYSLPKINSGNTWDAHQTSIQGFVTLKDLMLQKQEEEAQEMYNNRVLLGVEKKGDEKKRIMTKRLEETVENLKLQQQQQQQLEGVYKSKTQSRSLPKTPDYEISFKPDDEDIRRTRTKEGLKLRDFGYELISGDEPISGHSRQNSNISNNFNNNEQYPQQQMTKTARQFLKKQQFILSAHRNKKHSTASISSTTSSIASASSDFSEKRGDSFKKRGKLEAFKTSSERLFQFNKHHQQQQQQQQAQQQNISNTHSMTMTLPLHKKPAQIAYDEQSTASGSSVGNSIRKSHTYNHDLKDKAVAVVGGHDKYDTQRKNSAPIFSKLNFSHSTSSSSNNTKESKKEKKLLGSPLLHRTIFGRSSNSAAHEQTSFGGRDYDGEIFSQVILPKVPNHIHNISSSNNNSNNSESMKYRQLSATSSIISAPDVVAPPPPVTAAKSITATSPPSNVKNSANIATPEYPNMECPPVFEPEIYSLSDSNASLSLLQHRNNSTEGPNDKSASNHEE